jgi:hypothetical protein
MKNVLIILLSLAALGQAQTTKSKQLLGNIGQTLYLFGSQPNGEPGPDAQVNLDTSEIDTSKYFYELIDRPISGLGDSIVGYVHFRCKDSTGTDSLGVRLWWDGNSRADGRGTWATIDSVSLLGTGSSYLNATPTAISNAKTYMALRFRVKNTKVSAVGLKPTCRDFVLNRARRQTTFQ